MLKLLRLLLLQVHATDKGSLADLKPSDQALAEVLNVDAVSVVNGDGVSLLASIAVSVVPVAVASAVAQVVAARAILLKLMFLKPLMPLILRLRLQMRGRLRI